MVDAVDRILSEEPRPIWVVTAAAESDRGGLVATFVSRASIVRSLPRVALGLSVGHHTTELVRRSSACAVHAVTEAQVDWVWRFGLASGRDTDKLAGIPHRAGPTGAPILDGADTWLACRVESSMNTGDRLLFVAEVVDARAGGEPPLTVERLRALAPPQELARLDELYARDEEIDAERIRQFRANRG